MAKSAELKDETTKKVKAPAPTVHVNDHVNELGGDAAMIGGFATVTSGDEEGRYGVVESVASYDKDGFPETVVFRTRDDESESLVVDYADLKKADAGRR